MTTFNPIKPLWNEMPLHNAAAQAKAEPVYSFADIFRSAIKQVEDAQAEVDDAAYLLSTGQLDNPAYSSIAIAKAELSVSMLVNLRNKALDAYNELIRISI